jgi:hypothetical protein
MGGSFRASVPDGKPASRAKRIGDRLSTLHVRRGIPGHVAVGRSDHDQRERDLETPVDAHARGQRAHGRGGGGVLTGKPNCTKETKLTKKRREGTAGTLSSRRPPPLFFVFFVKFAHRDGNPACGVFDGGYEAESCLLAPPPSKATRTKETKLPKETAIVHDGGHSAGGNRCRPPPARGKLVVAL